MINPLLLETVQRQSSQRAICKQCGVFLTVAVIIVGVLGRLEMAALLWAAAPILLLGLVEAGYAAQQRRCTDLLRKGNAKDEMTAFLPESAGAGVARTARSAMSLSVWPFYVALLGIVAIGSHAIPFASHDHSHDALATSGGVRTLPPMGQPYYPASGSPSYPASGSPSYPVSGSPSYPATGVLGSYQGYPGGPGQQIRYPQIQPTQIPPGQPQRLANGMTFPVRPPTNPALGQNPQPAAPLKVGQAPVAAHPQLPATGVFQLPTTANPRAPKAGLPQPPTTGNPVLPTGVIQQPSKPGIAQPTQLPAAPAKAAPPSAAGNPPSVSVPLPPQPSAPPSSAVPAVPAAAPPSAKN